MTRKADSESSKEIEVMDLEQSRERLLTAIARIFDREDRLVAFLLELKPIKGSWEIVEMARNCGENFEEFWLVGVGEWLSRDDRGDRFAELSRVYRELTTQPAEAPDDA